MVSAKFSSEISHVSRWSLWRWELCQGNKNAMRSVLVQFSPRVHVQWVSSWSQQLWDNGKLVAQLRGKQLVASYYLGRKGIAFIVLSFATFFSWDSVGQAGAVCVWKDKKKFITITNEPSITWMALSRSRDERRVATFVSWQCYPTGLKTIKADKRKWKTRRTAFPQNNNSSD